MQCFHFMCIHLKLSFVKNCIDIKEQEWKYKAHFEHNLRTEKIWATM